MKKDWQSIRKSQRELTRLVAIIIGVLIIATTAVRAFSAPPDAFVRMESPNGCTGVIFYVDQNTGLIATCKHCTGNQSSAKFRFFKDGYTSPQATAHLVGVHPSLDAAVYQFDARRFSVQPSFAPLATPKDGPFAGQTVYTVGSFAGGTKAPAVQKTHITSTDNLARRIQLSEGAWGGHSGGPVITESGKLLGNVWGTTTPRPGVSLVAGVAAIYDILSHTYMRQPQVFYSIPPEKTQQASQKVISVRLTGTADQIQHIKQQAMQDHFCSHHIDWDDSPLVGMFRNTPEVSWHYNGKKWRLGEGWQGVDDFKGRLAATGVPVRCGPYRCNPNQQQQQQPFSPFNPWTNPPPAPAQQQDNKLIIQLLENQQNRDARFQETLIQLLKPTGPTQPQVEKFERNSDLELEIMKQKLAALEKQRETEQAAATEAAEESTEEPSKGQLLITRLIERHEGELLTKLLGGGAALGLPLPAIAGIAVLALGIAIVHFKRKKPDKFDAIELFKTFKEVRGDVSGLFDGEGDTRQEIKDLISKLTGNGTAQPAANQVIVPAHPDGQPTITTLPHIVKTQPLASDGNVTVPMEVFTEVLKAEPAKPEKPQSEAPQVASDAKVSGSSQGA